MTRVRTRDLTVVCEFNFSGIPLHLRQKKKKLTKMWPSVKYNYYKHISTFNSTIFNKNIFTNSNYLKSIFVTWEWSITQENQQRMIWPGVLFTLLLVLQQPKEVKMEY
jgi:hypothetical protein